MKNVGAIFHKSSRTRSLIWYSLFCLFLALSIMHQLFPEEYALVSHAQTNPVLRFNTYLPYVSN